MTKMLHVAMYVSTCISSISSDMSVSAQQTSVFVGSETRMPCRTTSQNPVEWTHWAIGAKMQRFVYANNLLSDGYNGPDGRHSIISKASFGIFDLVIANIRTSDAGTYKCFDDVGNFDNTNAIYEMTVIDSPPTCTSNVSLKEVFAENDCNIEPDHIEVSCYILFHGNVAPVLQWTHSTNGSGILDEPTTFRRTLNSQNNSTTFLTFKMNPHLNNTSFACAIENVTTTGIIAGCTLPSIYANYFFSNDRTGAVKNCKKPMESNDYPRDVKCAANTSIQTCDYHWRSQNSSKTYSGINSTIQLSELEPGTYQCFASCYIGRRNIQCPEYSDCLVLSAGLRFHANDIVGFNHNTFRIPFCVTLTLLICVVVVNILVVYIALKKYYPWFKRMRNQTEEETVPCRAIKGRPDRRFKQGEVSLPIVVPTACHN